MATRVHRPLKVLAFNASCTGRQRYGLRKKLQDLHVDVVLITETHLKPHSNFHFCRTDRHPGRKGETAVAVRKGIPHTHVDLRPLISIEATGVCIPIGNSVVLLAAVCRSPGRTRSDADITEPLSFRRKSILTGDLNAKTPFWNNALSAPSGEKLLRLFDVNQFEISAPQCPTHSSPTGNGDVLDIVVHQNTYQSVKCHCFRYFGLRSPTSSIPNTGSCQNKESLGTYSKIQRLGRVSKTCL
jgi:hypothetical protein